MIFDTTPVRPSPLGGVVALPLHWQCTLSIARIGRAKRIDPFKHLVKRAPSA